MVHTVASQQADTGFKCLLHMLAWFPTTPKDIHASKVCIIYFCYIALDKGTGITRVGPQGLQCGYSLLSKDGSNVEDTFLDYRKYYFTARHSIPICSSRTV